MRYDRVLCRSSTSTSIGHAGDETAPQTNLLTPISIEMVGTMSLADVKINHERREMKKDNQLSVISSNSNSDDTITHDGKPQSNNNFSAGYSTPPPKKSMASIASSRTPDIENSLLPSDHFGLYVQFDVRPNIN